MNANFRLAQIVVLVLVLNSPMTQSTAAEMSFKVGIASVMNGQLSQFGEQMRLGAEQATKSLHGDIKFVSVDDGCDAEIAKKAAKYLIEDMSVDAVIGHPCNAAALAAAPIYAEQHVPFLTFSSTPQLQMAGSEGRFRLCGREDTQVEIMTKHVLAEFMQGHVGKIVSPLSQLTTNLDFGFNAPISEIDDTKSLVAGFAQKQVKAVIVAGATTVSMQPLVRATRRANLDVAFILDEWSVFGIDAKWPQEEIWDGTVVNSNCYVPLDMESYAAHVGDEYEKGEMAEIGYAGPTVAAMQILARASKFVDAHNLKNLAHYLQSTTFDTAMGKVAFDETGEILARSDDGTDFGPYVHGWYMVDEGVLRGCTQSNPWDGDENGDSR